MAKDKSRTVKALKALEEAQELRLWRARGTPQVFADVLPRDSYPVGDERFLHWVLRYLWEKEGEAFLLRPEEWRMVQDGLRALALRDGVEYPLFVRVGGAEGEIFWDLGPGQPVVKIYPGGWELVDSLDRLPLRFLRSAYMHPLPVPERASPEEVFLLRELIPGMSGEGEENFLLLLGWLLGTLNPEAPYPILLLKGERGAGKTTTARVLKGLVDPHQVASMAPSPDLRDLMVAARWSHVLVLDNVSNFNQAMADALCRMATGEALYLRRLYTDYQEEVVTYRRPLVMTSVVDPMSQPDLIDRTLSVELQRVPDTERLPEAEFWPRVEQLRPRIMGALLALAAHALSRTDIPPFVPRMADFAVFAWRGLSALGLGDAFLDAYERSRGLLEVAAIYDNPALSVLVDYIRRKFYFRGTAPELLEELELFAGYSKTAKPWGWPSSPRALGNLLARFRGSLLALGIRLDRIHTREGNVWEVFLAGEKKEEGAAQSENVVQDDFELPLPKRAATSPQE